MPEKTEAQEITVREVMESRMRIAVETFLEERKLADFCSQTEIDAFAAELANTAFSAAGIPEKEQSEPW